MINDPHNLINKPASCWPRDRIIGFATETGMVDYIGVSDIQDS
jgi:hypothetical protein